MGYPLPMLFRSRPSLATLRLSAVGLVATLLAAPLLAACSGGDGSSVPPALAPTRPSLAPTLAPSDTPGEPGPVIPGQRPFVIPPPFTLPRVGGGTVSLSDHANAGRVVVIFYRGHF